MSKPPQGPLATPNNEENTESSPTSGQEATLITEEENGNFGSGEDLQVLKRWPS